MNTLHQTACPRSGMGTGWNLRRIAFLLAAPVLYVGAAFAQSASDTTSTTSDGKLSTQAVSAIDQSASTSTPAGGEAHAVRMSPFQVSTTHDEGYMASDTLAGTRLNSSLKDIAASIQVVTKQFMEDVNATDMTSLLVFTNDTDVAGYGGNYTGVSDPNAGSFSGEIGLIRPSVRIRGLATADQTRDYFLSNIPMDSYNVDRVDISRGANSILFGLGSPAGIINISTIQADVNRTKTSVTAQYGEYGSYRGTIDTNQVLIPDKLAVRVATLYGNTKYRINAAHYLKRGLTATMAYKPFKNTTLRITHEHGSSNSEKAQIRTPGDSYTWWWAAGQPVWDPTTATGHFLTTPQAPFTATSMFNANGTRSNGYSLSGNFGGWRASEAGLFYQDPNSSTLGGVNIGGGQTVDGILAFTPNVVYNPAISSTLLSSGMIGTLNKSYQIQHVYHLGDPLASLYSNAVNINDPHLFDFYHYQLGGPNQYEWGEWTNTNVTLSQTFFKNKAGIEVSYQKESTDNGYVVPSDYEIQIDINEKLPNGAPNPNYLRPVMANFGWKQVYGQDNEAYRATAFYDLDLRKVGPKWLGEILGHHMLQANYMAQEQFNESKGGYRYNNNFDFVDAVNVYTPGVPRIGSNARIVALVNYIGPSFAGTSTPQPVQPITAVQDPSQLQSMTILYNHDPKSNAPSALQPWQVGTFGMVNDVKYGVDNVMRYVSRTDLQVHSLSAAAQSYWFNGDLVVLLGTRKDRVWNFDAGNVGYNANGVADMRWSVYYPKLVQSATDSSSSYGIVAHLPEFLAVHLPLGTNLSVIYNHSDNFRLAGQRYNLLGEALPGETGTTREYGYLVSTFHGKLDFRITHFETVAGESTVNGLGNALNQLNLLLSGVVDRSYAGENVGNAQGIAQFNSWLASPVGQIYMNAFHYTLTPNPNVNGSTPPATYGAYSAWDQSGYQITATSATDATGWEYELTWNPVKYWRIAANASQAQVVRTNVAPEINKFFFGSGGLISLIQNPDGTPTAAGNLVGSPTSQQPATLQSWVNSNILNNGLIPVFAEQGTASDEMIKWNYRIVTNYTFDDRVLGGVLNGFSVGGAVRWSGQPLLGYGGTIITNNGNTLVVSDVNNPIYGRVDPIYDLWFGYQRKLRLLHGVNWKIQLNIHNVGVGNELIPYRANPDRTIVQWRIKQPQTWTLTNRFEF